MRKYTLALIFDQTEREVLLIHKLKPEWQNGKLNGVGGKIEEDEETLACVTREIREETNLNLDPAALTFIGTIGDIDWMMAVFTHVYQGNRNDARSQEAELINWHPIHALPDNTLANLRWMIPYALELLHEQRLQPFAITQKSHAR